MATSTDRGIDLLPVEDDEQYITRAWAIIIAWTLAVVLVATIMGVIAVPLT